MINNGKISENVKIDLEAFTASTVAGTSTNVSGLYDMQGYDRAFIGVSLGVKAAAAISTLSSVWVDLVESSAASVVGTSACGAKTGVQIGTSCNTAISSTDGIKGFMFQSGSAAGVTGSTTGDLFRLGLGTDIVTFTYSSLAANIAIGATNTNIKSTVAYFGSGSVVNTTADTGHTLLIDNLRNVLKSTQICFGGPNVFSFSTPSTYQLCMEIVNSTKGTFFYANTVSTTRMLGEARMAAVGFDIRADQLTSTLNKRFVGVSLSTAAQAVGVGITVIRSNGRYMPGGFVGKLSS